MSSSFNNRNPGDEGWGWSGVTPAQKDWSAGRMYEDIDTGRPLGPAASALYNANQVAEAYGSGYWTEWMRLTLDLDRILAAAGGDGSSGG